MSRTPQEIIDRYKDAAKELEELARSVESEWTDFVVGLNGYISWPPPGGMPYFLGIMGDTICVSDEMPEEWLEIPLTALTDMTRAKLDAKFERDQARKKYLEQELIRLIQTTDSIKDELRSL